jgi:hypothetical protein
MFDKMAEKGILFILGLLGFVQAWISIRYMIEATDDKSFGGIYKADKTDSDAKFTTAIISCSFAIMGYVFFMVKKERMG